jgi:hypothetical protein
MAKTITWEFAVVGCNLNDSPRYLGFTETYEAAVKIQSNMTALGWRRVAVFDADLKEVKEKPTET